MKCLAASCRTPSARGTGIQTLFFLAVLVAPTGIFAGVNGVLESARQQFDAGQYPQAATTLRAALERNPRDAAFHYWLARCYFELRDYDHAVQSAERSVQLDPGESVYHLWLGRAYGRRAEQAGWFAGFSLAKKSRREFEEAVRLDPSNLLAQRDLIEFYRRAPGIVGGGEDKAWKQAEALAAVDAVEGHLARGELWADKKKPEQAEQEYRLALAAKPQRLDAYLEVADFYLKRHDAVHMREVLEAARGLDPSDRRLTYYCGVVRVLAGDGLEEAEQCLKTYVTSVPPRSDLPSHADAHDWLGRLYEHQGKCAAARAQYQEALEINPHSKSAHEGLRRAQRCAAAQ